MAKRIYKPKDRIERTCIEIEKYNKEHGTHLSYGQYTALARIKKISRKRELQ